MSENEAWRHRLLEPPRVERVDALGPTGATLRVGARVGAVDRWAAVENLRSRLLVAFREAGIPMALGTSGGAVAVGGPGGAESVVPPAETGPTGVASVVPAEAGTTGDVTLDRTGSTPNRSAPTEEMVE